MFLDAMRLRLSLMAAGLVALVVVSLSGGWFGPRNANTLTIDYAIDTRAFEGAQVEVDGRIVGTLAPTAHAARTVFMVGKGLHAVRVLHPDYACAPRRVDVSGGSGELLMLEIGEIADRGGTIQPEITLR
jgi:hypothetical protein